MMNDVRFQRMNEEYQAVRNTQDSIMRGLDELLPAMMYTIQENRGMLLAIIEHLDVPYKPPTGFNPENGETKT